MTAEVAEAAVGAYTLDKFESRADVAARALLCASIRSERSIASPGTSTLNIVSLGCGPGNDAVGAILWAVHTGGFERVHVEAFDFAEGWGPVVEAVEEACQPQCDPERELERVGLLKNVTVSLQFGLADLRQGPEENVPILEAVQGADIVMLMYCAHESQAAEHQLFPAVLGALRPGCSVVVCDMWTKCIDAIMACVTKTEAEKGASFDCVPLGSEQAFPFKGVCITRRVHH